MPTSTPDPVSELPNSVAEASPAKGAFLRNVHLFRGVAIVAVVATHVLFEFTWEAHHVWEFKLSLSLVQNGTVLFVFVAGLLFQHLLYRFEYRKYLWGKCKFVLLPYAAVSIPYVLLQYYREFGIFAPWIERHFANPLLHAASMYISGAQMPIPLWFVPMITVFYFLAPVFAWVDRRPRRYWVILPLLVLASFIHRPQIQVMLRQSVFYFLPVYLCGMWVSRYMDRVMYWVNRLALPIVLMIISLLVFEVTQRERPGAIESISPFSTERGIYDVNIYMKLGLSLLALRWLQLSPARFARVLDPLANLSFGIFFLHFYVVYFARDIRRWLDATWPGTLLSVIAFTVVVVTISATAAWSLRKLMGPRSRYLIGC